MNAREYYESIRDDRNDWARLVPQKCMVCERGSDWPGLQIHEIERRSHAPNRWWCRCGALLVCQNCHEKVLSCEPHAKQLARKLLHDHENFDLESWLRISDPDLRAPKRVTCQDVLRERRLISDLLPSESELIALSIPFDSGCGNRKRKDYIGFNKNRWSVIGFAGMVRIGGKNRTSWVCICDCGESGIRTLGGIRTGRSKSCGCLQVELATTHGKWNSKTWRSWNAMLSRCSNPNATGYERYGGRGIGVCDRWKSFELFLEDMGERPDETSLDRINTNGDYEPLNCRWSTHKEQNRNKRNNVLITAFGKTKTMSEWAEFRGMSVQKLYYRLRSGWNPERAIGD